MDTVDSVDQKLKGKFPKNFLWGSATSAHQVEGGTVNDWSVWEEKNAHRLAKEARYKFGYLSNWGDIKDEATNPTNYISGSAADHYNRYKEDLNMASNLGHNAIRLSIEWARVEPEEGVFDQTAIEHYRDVLKTCKENNLIPFVTLWHWTTPIWLATRGGWENKEIVDCFLRYVGRVAEEFKDDIVFWMPLNEPGTYVGMSYIQGAFPPQKRLALFTANRVFKNLMSAYRESYKVIHRLVPAAQVGMSHYAVFMTVATKNPLSRLLVRILDYYRNWRFLNSINDTNDFIGIQYYHTDSIVVRPLMNGRWGFIDAQNSNTWITDMGWDVHPEGLYYLLKRAALYKKPIYITENGLADRGDTNRVRFIEAHVTEVARALQEGIDIRGYFYWSLLDNFEWDKGFWPRFGLIEIDYKTQTRKIRQSAYVYRNIIEQSNL